MIEKGDVALTSHVRKRMQEREFVSEDITQSFDVGKINKAPEWDPDHQQWKYTVDGSDVEGTPLSVVFSFDDDTLVLITGYRRDTI